ncbi:Hsp70 family protein [Exiguobacterium sp. MH3]|uniref:Hsp70 family protein n=1 Tax=Exiguobacterium sp. MH3 TaxID=1399115 RepID=UPI0003C40C57|nr:Hsp70 family protein [Exiguobacterium sp. MH3]AHA30850.1 2-alkenal reductase [Exiguobacterium sp. MH3]
MGIKVGIDLGTTNSAISYIKDGKPVIIENKEGDRTTPSAMFIKLENSGAEQMIVGKQAKNAIISFPKDVAVEAKRLMGTDEKITLGSKSYRPEEIASRILKYLIASAEERTGEKVEEAIITVPAYFNDTQRRATQKAAEIAGLKVERLINEPTAAAIAFAFENLDQQSNILVYDLGGGTFDVSIVEVFEGMIEVKASSGNNHLGGKDFDTILAEHIIDRYEMETGISLADLEDFESMLLRIVQGAENVKIQLSQQDVANMNLPFIGMHNGAPLSLNIDVSKDEFERLIRKDVESTLSLVEEAINDSGFKSNEITDIIMVGGSTRIPLVRNTVEQHFNRKVRVDINPDEVVALGAALQMGIKSQDRELKKTTGSGLMVIDVCPYSLGTEVTRSFSDMTSYYDEIIPRNTTLPAVKRKIYTTIHDNQDSVVLNVYQSEQYTGTELPTSPGVVQINDRELELNGLPPRPAGQVEIEVTFKYNLNGLLEVSAEVLGFGIQKQLEVRPKSSMSHFETREAAATLERDITKTELYNRMKPIILRANQMKKTASPEDRRKIETLVEELEDAMIGNHTSTAERIEEQLTDILIDLM